RQHRRGSPHCVGAARRNSDRPGNRPFAKPFRLSGTHGSPLRTESRFECLSGRAWTGGASTEFGGADRVQRTVSGQGITLVRPGTFYRGGGQRAFDGQSVSGGFGDVPEN